MVTTLFNGTRENFRNILPRSQSVDTNYFVMEITGELQDVYYPERKNPHQRKIIFYFDDTPIDNTRMVMGQLEQSGFKRTEYPPYSPDLARLTSFFLVT
jgi:hypothetical protein